VITSDHGDLLGEHGLYTHRNTLYRPLIQVPFIFWQPGHVPAGLRIETPVSNSSMAATIVDELGFSESGVFPNPSARKLWNNPDGTTTDWPHPLSELAQFKSEEPNFPCHYGAMRSLVTPQYHYMRHEKFGAELYDWVTDPDENANLANTREGHAITDALEDEIQRKLTHAESTGADLTEKVQKFASPAPAGKSTSMAFTVIRRCLFGISC
jgi:arylsulfatase A-like enzyme